ncbi:MAG: hypothetical protein ACXWR0_18500, partial [Bdellovibrio sp.]
GLLIKEELLLIESRRATSGGAWMREPPKAAPASHDGASTAADSISKSFSLIKRPRTKTYDLEIMTISIVSKKYFRHSMKASSIAYEKFIRNCCIEISKENRFIN